MWGQRAAASSAQQLQSFARILQEVCLILATTAAVVSAREWKSQKIFLQAAVGMHRAGTLCWLLAQPSPSPAVCQGLIQEGLQPLREPLCLPAVGAVTLRSAAVLLCLLKGGAGDLGGKEELPEGSRVSLHHPPDKRRRDNLWCS